MDAAMEAAEAMRAAVIASSSFKPCERTPKRYESAPPARFQTKHREDGPGP
jgi:hypothetical protein